MIVTNINNNKLSNLEIVSHDKTNLPLSKKLDHQFFNDHVKNDQLLETNHLGFTIFLERLKFFVVIQMISSIIENLFITLSAPFQKTIQQETQVPNLINEVPKEEMDQQVPPVNLTNVEEEMPLVPIKKQIALPIAQTFQEELKAKLKAKAEKKANPEPIAPLTEPEPSKAPSKAPLRPLPPLPTVTKPNPTYNRPLPPIPIGLRPLPPLPQHAQKPMRTLTVIKPLKKLPPLPISQRPLPPLPVKKMPPKLSVETIAIETIADAPPPPPPPPPLKNLVTPSLPTSVSVDKPKVETDLTDILAKSLFNRRKAFESEDDEIEAEDDFEDNVTAAPQIPAELSKTENLEKIVPPTRNNLLAGIRGFDKAALKKAETIKKETRRESIINSLMERCVKFAA